jgi:hypothetical protein
VCDIVWVQHQESGSREWFKCEVTAIRQTIDPSDGLALEYQLKLVDGGAPGTTYEKGKWLPADRLRDKNDRKSDKSELYETKQTQTVPIESSTNSRVGKELAPNTAQTIRAALNSTQKSESRLPQTDSGKLPSIPVWQREWKKGTPIEQMGDARSFTPSGQSGSAQITDLQPSDQDFEEVIGADEEAIDNESVVSDYKVSAGDSGYGTASVVDSNTVYDGQSVYSDGEQETVPKPVRPVLIKLVADEIRKNLDEGVLESIYTQDHGRSDVAPLRISDVWLSHDTSVRCLCLLSKRL